MLICCPTRQDSNAGCCSSSFTTNLVARDTAGMKTAYIYLIQDGEYRRTNVYKVGRTSQYQDTRSLNRICSYKEGTVQYLLLKVDPDHAVEIEREIISHFNRNHTLVRGREWFKGQVDKMARNIWQVVSTYNRRHKLCSTKRNTTRHREAIDVHMLQTIRAEESSIHKSTRSGVRRDNLEILNSIHLNTRSGVRSVS